MQQGSQGHDNTNSQGRDNLPDFVAILTPCMDV